MSTSKTLKTRWFLPVVTFRNWSAESASRMAVSKSAWALTLAAAGTVAGWSTAIPLARAENPAPQSATSQAALRELLTQADVEGRRSAVLEMAACSPLPSKAADLLLEPLQDSDVEVRALAAMCLIQNSQHTDAALLVLSDLLDSESSEERCLSAFLLGHATEQQDFVESRLTRHLSDDDAVVRMHVAESLLRLRTGNDSATKVLADSLVSSDPASRAFAVHALGSDTHTPSATIAYRVASRLADDDLDVAAGSALTLLVWTHGMAQPAEGAVVSEARSEQIDRLLGSETPATRRAAAVRLIEGSVDNSRMRELCRRHLRDDDSLVRACAALALCNSQADSVAVETTLVGLLESRSLSDNIVGLGTMGRFPKVSRPMLDAARRQLDAEHACTRTLASAVILKSAPRDAAALDGLAAEIREGTPEGRSLAARTCQLVDWQKHGSLVEALKAASHDSHLRTRLAAGDVLAGRSANAEIQRVGHTK